MYYKGKDKTPVWGKTLKVDTWMSFGYVTQSIKGNYVAACSQSNLNVNIVIINAADGTLIN
jgi:hypothetical protein